MRIAILLIPVSVVAFAVGVGSHLGVLGNAAVFAPRWAIAWQGGSVIAALAGLVAIIKQHRALAQGISADTASKATLGNSAVAVAVTNALSTSQKRLETAVAAQKSCEIQLKIATAQRRQAEAVLLSISDAVLVTDRFDQLLMANESASRMLDFDLAACNRSEVQKLVSDKALCQLIVDARSGGINGRRVVEHKQKRGREELVFKVTISSVTDAAGELAGIVTVLHDMTREREIAQMKNEFVSNVSHELRTPLASIRAYVEMLIDGEAEDEKTKRNFYDIIQTEANRLGRLIDNILNISRIESGLVKINQEPQSLTVIAKEAIEVIAPQAKLKQIKIDEQLTPIIYQTPADRDMIYQAMLNLLSNAIKYTPENGTITVQTTVDEARRCVVAKISDTGVGIPPKDLPFVFDKFYRAEANNRMAKGTGLGLSLVKHIIETVHSGKLIVESVVGKGSTFGFELALSE